MYAERFGWSLFWMLCCLALICFVCDSCDLLLAWVLLLYPLIRLGLVLYVCCGLWVFRN